MNGLYGHTIKTLLLMFSWMLMESSSLILQQNYNQQDWGRFWHRVRTSPAPNLLSSCPWEYNVEPGTIQPRVQIFQFANFHCIDLRKSGARGPFYDYTGRCKPVRFPVYSCGTTSDQTVIVAYTCVYSADIVVNKRGSELDPSWSRGTPSTNATYITSQPNNFKDRTTSHRTFSSQPHYIKDKTSTPPAVHLGFNDNKQDVHSNNNGDHSGSGALGGSSNQDQGGGHVSGTPYNQFRPHFVMPPFLNGGSAQQNRTGTVSQNMLAPRDHPPSSFFGNHNPQLGLPPVQRPMSLMDLIQGSVRNGKTDDSNSSDP